MPLRIPRLVEDKAKRGDSGDHNRWRGGGKGLWVPLHHRVQTVALVAGRPDDVKVGHMRM